MENKLDKPYKLKNKWIFENSITDDFEGLSCRDTDDGTCFYNESLEKCVSRINKGGIYFEIGDESICMPIDIKNNDVNPIQTFKRSSIYKQLDGVKTYTIIDEKYEFPPNISNTVFFNDVMTLKNTKTNWTIGHADYPVKDHAPISFDDDIDVNIIIIPENVEYLHPAEIPLIYGEKFGLSSNGSSLIINIGSSNHLVWHHITGYAKNDFCFKVLPIDNSNNIGDIVTYTDNFQLYCHNLPVYIDEKSGVLEFKTDTEVDYLNSFSFYPKSYGYYCKNNKSKKVLIRKIETDGVKGFYKGKPVFRNSECFGICEYNSKNSKMSRLNFVNTNTTSGKFFTAFLAIIFMIFLIFVLRRFKKRYNKIKNNV